jgi:ketosteroid isomerase-like protein
MARNRENRNFNRWLATAIAMLLFSGMAWSTQKKTKPKDDKGNSDTSMPLMPLPTNDELDRDIGEMLGAWQVGDMEAMHKYYDDNASFVSGVYEPPIVGWQNYVTAYQKQRARIQGMQLIRRNTFIFTRAAMAWASYQWEFNAMMDNREVSARGQTTLVFSHTGEKWLIVHNHTSQICESGGPAQSPQPQGTPKQNPPPQNPPEGPKPEN